MDEFETPGVLAPPPLLFAGGLLLGAALERVLGPPAVPVRAGRTAGAALLVPGVALGISAIAAIRRANSNVSPYAPTLALVERGPFAVSRNPVYLAMTLVYAGLALGARNAMALALLPAILVTVARGVVVREERYLERRFGDEYRAYRRHVRRWL